MPYFEYHRFLMVALSTSQLYVIPNGGLDDRGVAAIPMNDTHYLQVVPAVTCYSRKPLFRGSVMVRLARFVAGLWLCFRVPSSRHNRTCGLIGAKLSAGYRRIFTITVHSSC